ncbi:MAG: sel1 repeat family protein [Gammaproteobacteria bacterium]|nr:sel1 repeat family protein [Gammaproteobacteria bacterium]
MARRPRIAAALLALTLLSACGAGTDAETAFYARDFDASLPAFTERARVGDPVAQNFLGMHYYAGLGVARNYDVALRWFERAALAGQPDAQRNLGMMYMRGYGTTVNKVLAYGWMERARAGGNPSANTYMKQLSNQITPNQTQHAIKIVSELISKADDNKD